jgi:D-cysteine desulfhydrase
LNNIPMTPEQLRLRIEALPRLVYGTYPTPLQYLPRLSERLGGPRLWLKRDDGIGPGMGGNKGRKLEFLMAEAQLRGRRHVVTFGGLQSNHCRMTAAACAALGLKAHLFFFEARPPLLEGNLLLNELLGAKMRFIPFGGGGEARMTIESTNRLVRLVSAVLVGTRCYFIPVGGHGVTGCLGYVLAALELHEQFASLGLQPEKVMVILAAGSGGTLAGLMAGFQLLDSPVSLLAIDVGELWRKFPESIARLAGDICATLGQPFRFAPHQVPMVESVYAAPGYARFSSRAAAAIRLLARTEGVVLDPVYTGKAFAGLLDVVERAGANGDSRPCEDLVFLHSGGLPGAWAFGSQLVEMARDTGKQDRQSNEASSDLRQAYQHR